MLSIALQNVGKRYRYDWIFRSLSTTFEAGKRYAILGPNGSGKSTLMRTLAGHLTPSQGQIEFHQQGKKISTDQFYKSLAYAAPYIELIEEFTLLEQIKFHAQFKKFQQNYQPEDLLALTELGKSANKEIKFFSSGMKQRLKLALACCSDTPLLLLDEPTTNLDQQGVAWYLDLIKNFGGNRTIVVATNVAVDHQFCEQQLNILDYKKRKKGASNK